MEMSIQMMRSLRLDNEEVGVRVVTTSGVYDIAMDTLSHYGIVKLGLDDSVDLIPHNGDLVTQEELDGNYTASELEVDDSELDKIVDELKRDESMRYIFNEQIQSDLSVGFVVPNKKIEWEQVTDSSVLPFKQPFEYTLDEFILASDWEVRSDAARESGKLLYYILMPNREMHPTGWLKNCDNPTQAKAKFHRKMLKQAIRQGVILRDEVLMSHDTFHFFNECVNEIIENAYLQDTLGEVDVLFDIQGTKRRIKLANLPKTSLMEQRFFVSEEGLTPDYPDVYHQRLSPLDNVDVILYAMKKLIRNGK
jgi:hypothetical protein